MIVVSRCPCRISLLGGSSDLEWFLNRKGKGLSIGFSLSSYSRVAIGFRGGNLNRGLLNYSSREEYSSVDSISHPIIRKCFQIFSLDKPVELASFGDSLLGGGLATSSSFAISLIKSITNLLGKEFSNEKIAELACDIEIKNSNNSLGRQDQYLCALGGINFLYFKKKGLVTQKKYPFISEAIYKYSQSLYLINTSVSRSATSQLGLIKNDPKSYYEIEEILKIAENFISESLKMEDSDQIIRNLESSLKLSWEIKKDMIGVWNPNLAKIENFLQEEGFNIVKILGAGGGGYLLAKYSGLDIDKSTSNLVTKNIFINKVFIDYEGCKSWNI